jgi:hypothetical protein
MEELYNSYADRESPDFDEEMLDEMNDWQKLAKESIEKLNTRQRVIFNTVKEAVQEDKQELIFVNGDGGTG